VYYVTRKSCAFCSATLRLADKVCRSCRAAVSPVRHPLFGIVARTALDEPGGREGLVVTARDFMVLEELARLWLRPEDPARRALLQTLEQCQVVAPDSVAADVVTLDSRVVFRVNEGAVEERVIVLPDAHAVPGQPLPVTAPRALAMLGLRAGSTIVSHRRDGSSECIEILAVAYQPEEVARRRKAPVVVGTGLASPLVPPRFVGAAYDGRPPPGGDDPPPVA
jgi:regulator of nucleoside diphosphate kinase